MIVDILYAADLPEESAAAGLPSLDCRLVEPKGSLHNRNSKG